MATPAPRNAENRLILSPEQQTAYLTSGFASCPFCGTSDISGDSIEIDGKVAWQRVDCNFCDAAWQDVYSLSAIEDVDGSPFATQPATYADWKYEVDNEDTILGYAEWLEHKAEESKAPAYSVNRDEI